MIRFCLLPLPLLHQAPHRKFEINKIKYKDGVFHQRFPSLLIKKASFVLISRASVYLRFLDSRFRLLPWDFYEVVNVIVKVCFVFYLFSLVPLDLFTFRSVEGKHFLDMRYTIFHLLSIFNKCLAKIKGNFLPSKYRAIDEIRQF